MSQDEGLSCVSGAATGIVLVERSPDAEPTSVAKKRRHDFGERRTHLRGEARSGLCNKASFARRAGWLDVQKFVLGD